MHELAGLATDRLGDRRMGVPKVAHSDAAQRIQVDPAVGVPQLRPLAPGEGHRKTLVRAH